MGRFRFSNSHEEKGNTRLIQRKESSFIKAKGAKNSFSPPASTNSNKNVPAQLQSKLESSFGQDFSNVSIHANSQQAVQMNARAYTQGEQIHFAPGEFNPNSKTGQHLIGHEFAHIAQQRAGVVKPTKVLPKGIAINDNQNLEQEADVLGKKAINGEAISKYKGANTTSSSTMQRKLKIQGSTAKKQDDFVKKINDGSHMKFELDSANFLQQKYMPQIPMDVYDNAMLSAVEDPQTVVLRLIDKSDSVFIDYIRSGEVDLDDMLGMPTNVFKSWLLHFVVERFAIKDYETNRATLSNAAFLPAHKKGHEVQEKFLKELYPSKTVKFVSDAFDESTRVKDASGNGSVDYVFDYTDIKYRFTQEIKSNVTIENILKTKVEVAP
jgi:hypothetical protein